MLETDNSINSDFSKSNYINTEEKVSTLTKVIEDLEDFFLQAKEDKLYRFLMKIIEKPLIENILQRTEGNQLRAAKILGINRNTLHTKIKRLKINVNDFKERRIATAKTQNKTFKINFSLKRKKS